jgi:hypothetical protein
LRELGEVASLTPFRFLGGLQETLFDSPRFSFVADQLRRVRDRFEQVSIVKQDVAYVVANRLLRKNDQQLAWITDHLRKFTQLYAGMAERLGQFAELFPIHPAYIDTFEAVVVAEKREILKTFSQAMGLMVDEEVPEDRPGLLAYDHYWQTLANNPSMRTYPEVAEVLDKGGILRGRVEHAFARPLLKPMALRIVDALGVDRLTTGDITTPIGPTPEALRDDLCLYVRTPEETADFLADQVRVALKEIMRTVSGQYISHDETSDQYYLDVKKDIDFEAKIRERGETLSDDNLNRHFFGAMQQVLGLSDSTYTPGHRVWPYEVRWADHKVTRPGYLFLAAPNERSTAQPPRDFYLYLLPPFREQTWQDERRADEVIFRLSGLDQTFKDRLRQYAGAQEMANDSAAHRGTFLDKARDYQRELTTWLRDHAAEHLEVISQGVTEPAAAVLAQAHSTAGQGFGDLLEIIARLKLEPHFDETYPDYPSFTRLSQPVTEEARSTDAMDAIQIIAGRGRRSLGAAVLDALELTGEDGVIRPDRSRYARRFLELLESKPEGQVVNRGELIVIVAGGVDRPVEKDRFFQLEPEWVAVVLTALVYSGDITLTTGSGQTLDAGNVERAATTALDDLTRFRFFARPKAIPLGVWTSIFEGLGLQAALMRDETKREQAVRDLLTIVEREQRRVATLTGQIGQGIKIWNMPLFTDNVALQTDKFTVVGTTLQGESLTSTGAQANLRGYAKFLAELNKFNTVGKLRNLRLHQSEVSEALGQRKEVERTERLLDLVAKLQPLATYLAVAQENLPAEHAWSMRAAAARGTLIDTLRRIGKGDGDVQREAGALQRDLEDRKREYIGVYSALHREAVLSQHGEQRRARLLDDPRLKTLKALATIELLSKGELDGWMVAVRNLTTCSSFREALIEDAPTCPECGFRPVLLRPQARPAETVLSELDHRLDTMLINWRQALRAALDSESAKQSIENMSPRERTPIEAFLTQGNDDVSLPAGFPSAATTALRGIQAITLQAHDLFDALSAGGLPCTRQDLEQRFQTFVTKAMREHDPRNTRIMLERAETAEVIELAEFARKERA